MKLYLKMKIIMNYLLQSKTNKMHIFKINIIPIFKIKIKILNNNKMKIICK